MKINKNMTLREIAGENILVPGANAVLDLNGLFVVTETGAFIWSVLPEAENEQEIVARILEEYEIDEETAKADVSEFLGNLRKYGII